MNKDDFRGYASLLILVTLIDRRSDPVTAAIAYADELIKELNKDGKI